MWMYVWDAHCVMVTNINTLDSQANLPIEAIITHCTKHMQRDEYSHNNVGGNFLLTHTHGAG